MGNLVLSLFPGIGILDMGFEEQGFCVVRGPDILWGGDVKNFHPPAGVFDGVIGGPPCQEFSVLANLVRHNGHKPRFGNLIPEYERCVAEAQPRWFVMENVKGAPIPAVGDFIVRAYLIRDQWVGGITPRLRRLSFGTRDGRPLHFGFRALMEPMTMLSPLAGHGPTPGQLGRRSITGNARVASVADRVRSKEKGGGVLPGTGVAMSIEDMCTAQGLPGNFTKQMPFTMTGKRSLIGNAVPLAMARSLALAVVDAMSRETGVAA